MTEEPQDYVLRFGLPALGGWACRAVASAARYQEDALRTLELIHSVYQHKQVTSDQLVKALVGLGLDPYLLYHQLSAGYETPQLNLLAEALGLPEKSLCSAPPQLVQSFEQAMTQLINQAGQAQEELGTLSQAILDMAAALPEAKPKQKVPYYQKDKAHWWKGRRPV